MFYAQFLSDLIPAGSAPAGMAMLSLAIVVALS